MGFQAHQTPRGRRSDALQRFEEEVLAQRPTPAEHYDDAYFISGWRDEGNRYDLETRRRVEGRNPALIKEVFDPARVLDVGCGPGALMFLLSELGIEVDGIDFSAHVVSLAPESVRSRISIGPVDRSHVPDQTYDLVICREVFEHLTVLEIRRTVAAICRASAGFVYATTRFHEDPDGLLDFTTQFEVDPSHITLLNKDFLRCLFVLEGFRCRPDLEERMDWGGKGRVLVYERTAEATAADTTRPPAAPPSAEPGKDKQLREIDARLAGIEQRLGGTGIGGKLRHIEIEIQAVQRHLRLTTPEETGHADVLLSRRFKGQSQNEEDGITLAIFERAGIEYRRFVELGCGGTGGNSGFFAKELGWSGLMVDTRQELVERSRQLNPATITAVRSWITRDGVNDLVKDNGYEGDVDLLSIDIDGNDWWIWEALTVVNPRLVITEYNSNFGAERAVTVPYEESFDRHAFGELQRVYYGASLAGFEVLARRRGYRLVAVEPRGVNAYWLREDLAPDLPRRAPHEAYRMLDKHLAVRRTFPDIFAELERRNLELVELKDYQGG